MHCMYKLDGEVHKTIMLPDTSDLSKFCAFVWFEWVIFQDKTALYLNNHVRLDRYLGPSIHVSLTMSAKIIKENVQVLHRSTNGLLT